MFRKNAAALAIGITLALLAPILALAGASEFPSMEHNQYCVTGSEAAALSQAAQQRPDAVASLAGRSESVTLVERGEQYTVATPTGSVIASSRGRASEPKLLCSDAQRPSAHGYSVPAQYASGLGAVDAFLQSHPWQSINDLRPGLQVNVWDYGSSYMIVQIALAPTTPNPGVLEGCTWASYRVTIATGAIYQFDSCGPPHDRGLPTFSQLPPS